DLVTSWHSFKLLHTTTRLKTTSLRISWSLLSTQTRTTTPKTVPLRSLRHLLSEHRMLRAILAAVAVAVTPRCPRL
ncbi:hypothetical protein BGZ52_002645, partial [Haplosporangium bisporale]